MRVQAMAWLLALVRQTRLYGTRRAMGMGNSGEEQPKRRSVAGVARVYVTPTELSGVAYWADGCGATATTVGLQGQPTCAAHRWSCRVCRAC